MFICITATDGAVLQICAQKNSFRFTAEMCRRAGDVGNRNCYNNKEVIFIHLCELVY